MSRTLIKDSAIYGLGTILTRSLGLVLIPLYTQFLTVSEYGALGLLNLILMLSSFLTLMGISSGAMRFYYNENASDEYRRNLYGNATTALIIFPPIVFILIVSLSYPLFDNFLPEIPFFPLIAVILATAIFSPVVKLLTGFLRVQQRPIAFIIFNIVFFTTQMVIIVIAVGLLQLGLKGQVFSQLLTNFLFWVAALYMLFRYSKPRLSTDILRPLLAFGLPMIPFFIFMWITNAAGRFALEHYATLEHVGIFTLAAQFSGLLLMFAVAFDNALLPHFFKVGNNQDGSSVLGKLVIKYIALFGILGLCINVASPPIIILIAKQEYFDAINYLGPLTFAFWLFICTYPITWSLKFSKKTNILSTTRAISALVLICLLVFFLGYMKLSTHGVILSMILVNIMTIVIGFTYSQKEYFLLFERRDLFLMTFIIVAGWIAIEAIPADTLDLHYLLYRLGILAATTVIIIRLLGLHSLNSIFKFNN